MVPQFVSDLHLPLSQIRLESYRPSNGTDLQMVANYFWDMELAKALTPALHAVEVALRNGIHGTLMNHYGTDMWFYLPGVLEPGQLGQLANALRELGRRKASPTSGRIVAELNFGFWVTLLSSNYEQRLWQPQGFALLWQVFPNARGQSIQNIQRHYNGLRGLRNRVSHYEASWDRPNLANDCAHILTAIGWISSPLRQAVDGMNEFSVIFNHGNGHRAVQQRLRARLGI